VPTAETAALVTGASSGIGAELARQLAARGHTVVLAARRADRLAALAGELERSGVRAEPVACDLCEPAGRDRLEDAVAALGLDVNVLCNNAGGGVLRPFLAGSREQQLATLRLDVETVVDLCARFVPGMVRRGGGAVLNVCSLAGFVAMPRQATYAASKAAALRFTEALHVELRDTRVAVTALCPGGVRSEFVAVAGAGYLDETVPGFFWTQPPDVARAGLRGLAANRRVVVPGALYRPAPLLLRLVPTAVTLRLLDRLWPVRREDDASAIMIM
jgi:short-subunit dehydrogenase